MKRFRYYLGNGVFVLVILIDIMAIIFGITTAIEHELGFEVYAIIFVAGLFYAVFGYGAKMLIIPKDMR